MQIQPIVEWNPDNIDLVADAIALNEFCVINNFIDVALADGLLEAFDYHLKEDNFKKAGIGKMHHFAVDKKVRGDHIKWIERDQALPASTQFIDKIESLMHKLNYALLLSLKDYECHFAIYPPGSYYEKHLDQFKGSSNRKISFALYLNKNWVLANKGALRIYRNDLSEDIDPIGGRLVLFRSDTVEHEVLITNKDRFSITGWMLDRPIDLPYF